MRPLAILVVSFALACGSGEPVSTGSEAPSAATGEATDEATDPGTEPTAAPGEAATDAVPDEASAEDGAATDTAAPDGDLCARARACCRAYVGAIPSARRPLEERGCTEMDAVLAEAGEASDDVCEAAIGGWRQSLQLTGVEVPPDCR